MPQRLLSEHKEYLSEQAPRQSLQSKGGPTVGAEPVPLFSATLRENQGQEPDRSAAA